MLPTVFFENYRLFPVVFGLFHCVPRLVIGFCQSQMKTYVNAKADFRTEKAGKNIAFVFNYFTNYVVKNLKF